MDRCWEHKKLMAPGCEPKICKQIIDAIRPISYGKLLIYAVKYPHIITFI